MDDCGDVPDLEECGSFQHVAKSDSKSRNPSHISGEYVATEGDCLEDLVKKRLKRALKKKDGLFSESSTGSYTYLGQPRGTGTHDSCQLEIPSWVTPDLLKKIESNPNLFKWLQDPNNMAKLSHIQSNPSDFLKNHNVDVNMDTIKEFAALLGNHFENLADSRELESKVTLAEKKPFIEEIVESPEEKEIQEKVKSALANDAVKEALLDKRVRKIIASLKENTFSSQCLISEAAPGVKAKLKLLVEHGILGVNQ